MRCDWTLSKEDYEEKVREKAESREQELIYKIESKKKRKLRAQNALNNPKVRRRATCYLKKMKKKEGLEKRERVLRTKMTPIQEASNRKMKLRNKKAMSFSLSRVDHGSRNIVHNTVVVKKQRQEVVQVQTQKQKKAKSPKAEQKKKNKAKSRKTGKKENKGKDQVKKGKKKKQGLSVQKREELNQQTGLEKTYLEVSLLSLNRKKARGIQFPRDWIFSF